MNRIPVLLLGVLALTSLPLHLRGGDLEKVVIDDKSPVENVSLCRLFDSGTVFESDGFFRSLTLKGRYHGQFVSMQEEVDGVTDNGFHDWEHRRFRLGFDLLMAHDLELTVNANIADGSGLTRGPFIDDFFEFYLTWQPQDDFFVKAGKMKHPIGRDDIETSNKNKVVERSQATNEMGGGRPWGVMVGFATGEYDHAIGGWLYGGHLDAPSWVDFDSHGGLSYNLSRDLSENTTLFLDYAFSNNDGGRSPSQGPAATDLGLAYEHVVGIGAAHKNGRFSLTGDVMAAFNREGSGTLPVGHDTWGGYLTPSYDLTDRLQAVFRYGYLESGREQRTQRFPVRQNVEDLHTLYFGFQYFLCGDNLKLMGGYELASGEIFGTGSDLDSGTWLLAVRSYF